MGLHSMIITSYLILGQCVLRSLPITSQTCGEVTEQITLKA